MKETNIFEIPKIHPFIKTLEKVKELKDNLPFYDFYEESCKSQSPF